MAIFSQKNKNTSIDYRNRKGIPNREVKHEVPKELKTKILKFTRKLKMKTASLDFVVDLSGNYVFLDINPVGQYDNLSENCNYSLDFEIAKYLVK